MLLPEVPLKRLVDDLIIPYEDDAVTRLIVDRPDAANLATATVYLTTGQALCHH